MTTAELEEILIFLKKAHDEFQSLSIQIKFDNKLILHLYIMALYGSIFEITGSVILLIDKKIISAVPILLRSILEAYVDLINLTHDPNYGNNLKAAYIKERLKILNIAKTGENPYLQNLSSILTLDKTIEELKQEKDNLKIIGHFPLSNEGKFKQAGMLKEYLSIYNSLCCESHNNLNALIQRHFKMQDETLSVVFYKNPANEDWSTYLVTITDIFIKSAEIVHNFFNSPVKEEIITYTNKAKTLFKTPESVY